MSVIAMVPESSETPEKSDFGYGGVWIGNTNYSDRDAESESVNVGSFFMKRWSPGSALYTGFAISTNHSLDIIQDEYNETDGTLEYYDREILIEETSHIPIEYNVAYVLETPVVNLGIGGGVSFNSVETYISYELSSSIDDSVDADFFADEYCEADLGGGTSKYLYGYQFFVSAEYSFGGDGGNSIGPSLSTFFQMKYQYVQPVKVNLEGTMTCEYFQDDNGVETVDRTSRKVNEEVEIKLTNISTVLGLAYHF